MAPEGLGQPPRPAVGGDLGVDHERPLHRPGQVLPHGGQVPQHAPARFQQLPRRVGRHDAATDAVEQGHPELGLPGAGWRLEVRNGTLTWHMLTRRTSVPVKSIQEIVSELHVAGDEYTHVLVLDVRDGEALRLESGLWKERELKAIIRQLRDLHQVPVAPAVEQWLG